MKRRDFLKIGGLVSAALWVSIGPLGHIAKLPVELGVRNILYRGTLDGNIHISEDAGKTWRLHTRFGHEYFVQNLFVDMSEQVHAQMGFAGRSFDLVLAQDGRNWKTVA
jgi:hypothetical protein